MKSIVSIRYLKKHTAAANKIQKAYRDHIFRLKLLQFGDINRQAYCAGSDDSADLSPSESYISYKTCELCHDKGPKGLHHKPRSNDLYTNCYNVFFWYTFFFFYSSYTNCYTI